MFQMHGLGFLACFFGLQDGVNIFVLVDAMHPVGSGKAVL
jgi:hypothetical protein